MRLPALIAVFGVLSLSFTAASAQTATQADPHAGHGAMAPSAMGGVQTSPAEGFMSSTAPTAFTATFAHPMTLTGLTLATDQAQPAPLAVAPAEPARTVSAPLPVLAPGDHRLTWTAVSADGHAMTGVVRFMVH